MKKIKEFFSKLRQDNSGESIVIDEDKFKQDSSERIMNENIRRYNKLLEEIERIRREIRVLIPQFETASREFLTFVSIPKEREDKKDENEEDRKKKNPYINDFMLRRNEFEEKTRMFKEVFHKISELRKNEINKYFEAKRLINDNSIRIGEIKREIEITEPEETIDEINMSNRKKSGSGNTDKD